MRIQRSDGAQFTMDFAAYQFPDETEYWDANWLMVAIAAKHPDGSWRTTDPSLLTFEGGELATWLDAFAGDGIPARIRFIEPNLSFEGVSQGGGKHLRIYFELESRPAWATSIPVDDFWLEFPCTVDDLRRAATDVRRQLETFPVRGTRDADAATE